MPAVTARTLSGAAATRLPPSLWTEARAPLALEWRGMMLDAMYLAIGFGFLVVAVLYVMACDRL